MALSWVLRHPGVTSALIGASRPEQIRDNVKAVSQTHFSDDELAKIDGILEKIQLPASLWAGEGQG
jgi:L-glyceraldehyde 3-phosphate reductase